MNTVQLQKIISQDKCMQESFLGVFPSDYLPTEIIKYPACFIANVDSSTEPGSHWLAFYISTPKRIEFFDSYGNAPVYYKGPISNFVSKFLYVDYNPMTLQTNASAVCGHYCVYYLYCKCRGQSLRKILSSFVTKSISNDKRVYDFILKHFHVRTNFFFFQ